jgi:hypothetical protein
MAIFCGKARIVNEITKIIQCDDKAFSTAEPEAFVGDIQIIQKRI